MKEAAQSRVAAIVAGAAGLHPDQSMDEDTPLVGGGLSLDSVVVLELLVALEKEFQVELDPLEMRQARALQSVRALARFINAKLRAG